jgi:parallel beta-helix repeat protein
VVRHLILSLSLVGLWTCTTPPPERAWKSIEKSLQTQFITAHDGDTIVIPEGNFMFTRSLTLDGKANIVIRGAGIEKTILSWQNQEEGAQGLQVSNSRNIVLQDFSVEDAKGDNLKVNDTQGITIRRVRSVWTAGPRPENGAYAIYPVLCKRVLMEECIAMGASDAGIYVGQSDSVIIRSNVAYWNVAGIEAENSRWVEIYDNESYDNTGGLLIFDLPGLTQYGHSTNAHHNRIHDNNHENFAQEGNIVASVPPGSGIMILATHNVQLNDNEIKDNRSVGVAIISYDLVAALNEGVVEQTGAVGGVQTLNNHYKEDSLYNPYPYDIAITANQVSNSHWFPSLGNDIGKLLIWYAPFSPPDFIFDGIADPLRPERRICFSGNADARFINLDAGNDFKMLSKDITPFECRPDGSGQP